VGLSETGRVERASRHPLLSRLVADACLVPDGRHSARPQSRSTSPTTREAQSGFRGGRRIQALDVDVETAGSVRRSGGSHSRPTDNRRLSDETSCWAGNTRATAAARATARATPPAFEGGGRSATWRRTPGRAIRQPLVGSPRPTLEEVERRQCREFTAAEGKPHSVTSHRSMKPAASPARSKPGTSESLTSTAKDRFDTAGPTAERRQTAHAASGRR